MLCGCNVVSYNYDLTTPQKAFDGLMVAMQRQDVKQLKDAMTAAAFQQISSGDSLDPSLVAAVKRISYKVQSVTVHDNMANVKVLLTTIDYDWVLDHMKTDAKMESQIQDLYQKIQKAKDQKELDKLNKQLQPLVDKTARSFADTAGAKSCKMITRSHEFWLQHIKTDNAWVCMPQSDLSDCLMGITPENTRIS